MNARATPSARPIASRLRHAWRHARHRLFTSVAEVCRLWATQCDDARFGSGAAVLGAGAVTNVLRGARAVVATLVSRRTRLAWHRARVRTAWRDQGPMPRAHETLRDVLPSSAHAGLLLSSRLPADDVVRALRTLRYAGQCPAPIFHRALARLARTADGQVDPTAGSDGPSVWGDHSQYQFGAELAQWAVTRAAWRRDPALRVLVTSARFATHGRRMTLPVIQRFLTVALDQRVAVTTAERTLALCDAFTWPEFAAQGSVSTRAVERAIGHGPAQDRPSFDAPADATDLWPDLFRHLTPEDLGALLASPYPAVRAWVLTTVLPAQHATPALLSPEAAPVVGEVAMCPTEAVPSASLATTPPDGERPVRRARR